MPWNGNIPNKLTASQIGDLNAGSIHQRNIGGHRNFASARHSGAQDCCRTQGLDCSDLTASIWPSMALRMRSFSFRGSGWHLQLVHVIWQKLPIVSNFPGAHASNPCQRTSTIFVWGVHRLEVKLRQRLKRVSSLGGLRCGRKLDLYKKSRNLKHHENYCKSDWGNSKQNIR